MFWQDVTRSSLCSGVTQLSHSQILRTTVLGMFKDSAIILDVIRQSFLTKSARAAMFTSVSKRLIGSEPIPISL